MIISQRMMRQDLLRGMDSQEVKSKTSLVNLMLITSSQVIPQIWRRFFLSARLKVFKSKLKAQRLDSKESNMQIHEVNKAIERAHKRAENKLVDFLEECLMEELEVQLLSIKAILLLLN